jgi:hypothetical protein
MLDPFLKLYQLGMQVEDRAVVLLGLELLLG